LLRSRKKTSPSRIPGGRWIASATSTATGVGGSGRRKVTDFFGDNPDFFTGDRSEDLTGDVELAVLELDGRIGEAIESEVIEVDILRRFGDTVGLLTSSMLTIAGRLGEADIPEEGSVVIGRCGEVAMPVESSNVTGRFGDAAIPTAGSNVMAALVGESIAIADVLEDKPNAFIGEVNKAPETGGLRMDPRDLLGESSEEVLKGDVG
jgi:hypothetical protein